MPYPRSFRDDGTVLHLDLHGCTVADALVLVRRALEAGSRVGRARLDVVHGYSSSSSPYDRTIKNAVADAWEAGAFDAWVADIRWDEAGGRCEMWLKVGSARNGGRLTVRDIA